MVIRYRRKNGEVFSGETVMTTVNDGTGAIIACLGFIRDVTERERAEQQLRKLSEAVEQSPASVIITDPEGAVEYVNQRFLASTGYSPGEALAYNIRRLVADGLSPEAAAELWDTISSGREWHGELESRRRNGDLYWQKVSISRS